METDEVEKKNKRPKKQLKKDSNAYLRQREKANARKRKFLDNLTPEQREIKRAKDREYYQKKKAENKIIKIADMADREKRKQRKQWQKASKKYREKKKMLVNIVSNTPPSSEDELNLAPEDKTTQSNLAKKKVGRKIVRKDRAKAYRKIQKQEKLITQMRRKIQSIKKKLQRNLQKQKKKSLPVLTPNSKVNDLVKGITVPPELILQIFSENVISDPLELFDGVEPLDIIEDMRHINNRQSIYKTIYDSSSSDDEHLKTISIRKQNEQTLNNIGAGTSYGSNKENMHPNLISPGTFLLIKVPTQKQNDFYRYVGISETSVEDNGEVEVTFLKSVRKSAKVFKLDPTDMSYITYEQIIEILPRPSIKNEKRLQYYYFKSNVDIFEKC